MILKYRRKNLTIKIQDILQLHKCESLYEYIASSKYDGVLYEEIYEYMHNNFNESSEEIIGKLDTLVSLGFIESIISF